MPDYAYTVVDVFTEVALAGNPLAVFPDARGLDDTRMQAVARELNLSETSFIFPPEDRRHAARLRIFTPGAEVPFAGHPTIGTAFVLVAQNRIPNGTASFVLEERIGLVPIRLERRADPFLAWLTAPPISFGAAFDRSGAAHALGLAPGDLLGAFPVQQLASGNAFVYVPLRDRASVDRATLDAAAMRRVCGQSAVVVFTPTPDGAYTRMFAPDFGIIEDPATGSATGPLAAYLFEHALVERKDGLRFVSEQGTAMGRRSILHVLLHVSRGELSCVEVGGSAVMVAEATMRMPP
jgi:trans-2,3-dihydro-3-hydroxyanthranilate isomerase